MTPGELAGRLSGCLTEAPSEAERVALADALRAFDARRPEAGPVFAELAGAIERGPGRRELALAAAKALRLLAQNPPAAEPAASAKRADRAADPPAEKVDRRRIRAEYRQARELEEDRADKRGVARPVECLPGIGKNTGLALRARGLYTLGDLAWLMPLGYHDERVITPLGELMPGARQVTEGRVVSASMTPRGRARRMAEVLLEATEAGLSDTKPARLRLVWFRAPAGLLSRFRAGDRFRVAGLVERFGGVHSMTHPQTEYLSGDSTAAPRGVVPRYPIVAGVPPRVLTRAVQLALERCVAEHEEAIPTDLRREHGLGRAIDALRTLHAPPSSMSAEELERWTLGISEHHARLALDEFFLLELALHKRRTEEQGVRAEALHAPEAAVARARAALRFALTGAQERAVAEIHADMQREEPMRRLLQGDVGSGKTAVGLLAAAHAIAAGAQAAFMAPTEVLAEQHFRVLAPLAEAMGMRAALTLGGERASHRKSTRKALEQGRVDLIVGTHALLSEGVQFARLRLVIVDEQHRFGVGQRLRLVDKSNGGSAPALRGGATTGLAPHLLVMTATPIPRSLALALHGDLRASVLDELPPGRIPPVTRAYRAADREQALRQLERGLESGGQAYVVCPAIEPNEETGLRSVQETFAELQPRLERYGIELLHSKLAPEARQQALERFVSGKSKVVVSTTIVEVGLDVTAANVMLIEQAERFGLAQLHQLRGRVGRGGQRSACLLVHEAASEEARARLAVMCDSHDGFKIAEEDLRLRGPGELFGRKQSGLPGFRFGDLRRDQPLLQQGQALAARVIAEDPELTAPEHAGARAALALLAVSDRAVVKEEAG